MRWNLFLLFFITTSCYAVPIEQKNGKTIITLKVWNLPKPDSKSIHAKATLKALELFKQDFPKIFAKKYKTKYKANPNKYGNYNWDNVKIKVIKSAVSYIEGTPKDIAILATDKAPDVLYVNFRKSCNFIKNRLIIPLDQYYNTLTPEQITWRVDPKVKSVARRKGPDGNIHWWTMPYGGVLGKAILFHKNVFDKHKIPYPDKNWTWNDFMEICRKTTNISKNKYGFRLGSGLHESWFWTTFLWSAGGEITAYNKKIKRWEYAFNSDKAVEALDFYTQLSTEKHIGKNGKVYRGYAYKDFRNANDMWMRGDIAMWNVYVEKMLIVRVDLKKYGIAPVPLGPTGIRGSELNNRMFGINAQIKDAAIKDAAWEYMLYYDSLKAQKILVEMLIKNGEGNLINPIYLKKFGYDSIAKKVDPKLVEAFNIAISTGVPEPYRTISSQYSYQFMTEPIQFADELAQKNKLAPEGSKKRYKQLKAMLNMAVAYANRINNQEWQKLKKK